MVPLRLEALSAKSGDGRKRKYSMAIREIG